MALGGGGWEGLAESTSPTPLTTLQKYNVQHVKIKAFKWKGIVVEFPNFVLFLGIHTMFY